MLRKRKKEKAGKAIKCHGRREKKSRRSDWRRWKTIFGKTKQNHHFENA